MPPTPQPFDWFGPEAVKELHRQVKKIGAGRCRLEVYRNEKGAQMLQLRRVHPDGTYAATAELADPEPINNSFICPPFCRGVDPIHEVL